MGLGNILYLDCFLEAASATSWPDPDIAYLAVKNLGCHEYQRIIGQPLSQLMRTVIVLQLFFLILIRSDEAEFEVFLEKVENKFGEEFNVFFLAEQGAVCRIRETELELSLLFPRTIGSLQVLCHPQLSILDMVNEFGPVTPYIVLMGVRGRFCPLLDRCFFFLRERGLFIG